MGTESGKVLGRLMEIGLDFGLAVLSFFVVIGPLIFFHEMGHFLAARRFGVTVEEFGIGYPPRMLTLFERKGTKYTLNWIPLGGFMRPAGEDDPAIPGGLAAAPKRVRFAVLAAGPAANLLVAFILLAIMFMVGAPEQQPGAEITAVQTETPAEAAGLLPGDVILRVDDLVIDDYSQLGPYVYNKIGEPITLMIRRGSETLEVELRLRSSWPEDQGPMGIGYQPVFRVQSYGFFQALGRATREMWSLMETMARIPALVIEQQIPLRFLRPVSVVGISQLGGQAIDTSIQQNAAWPIIQLTAFISVALAITNLLPIPALDGGRILFVLIEAIRGKRMDPQREMVVHFIGFAVLMLAMVVFVYLDIVDPLVQ